HLWSTCGPPVVLRQSPARCGVRTSFTSCAILEVVAGRKDRPSDPTMFSSDWRLRGHSSTRSVTDAPDRDASPDRALARVRVHGDSDRGGVWSPRDRPTWWEGIAEARETSGRPQ